MLLGIFTPHASYFFFAGLNLFWRCLDRGFCRGSSWESIYKQQEERGEDGIDVWTGQLIQDDLNAIYTGEEIYSHYVYSSLYGYFIVVLTFSAGIPVLIPFAAIFFFVFYCVYKCLLTKYYARATTFNEGLPLTATRLAFPIGIVLHLFFGSLMVSNADIFNYQNVGYTTLLDSKENII